MKSSDIRNIFLEFFKEKGHSIIPSASLIPDNDPSVLFNTAGMQPLVPYLLGEKHPEGTRLANVQKCVRTGDIDEIGDATHVTFFEMLGNWSLGDYFKKEAIKWSYELLTDKEKGLGLDPERIFVTIFEGNEDAPRDDESYEIWKSLGIPEDRIYELGVEDNWWSPGDNGPSGPDTEMFYDVSGTHTGSRLSKKEFLRATDRQEVVEIWNDVFMEYEKKDGSVVGKLSQKNVDTGAGLERLAMVLQEKENIFETDIFEGLMNIASKLASDSRSRRIIADHIRTAVFLIGDGVVPSNTDQGYVLRRLLRRLVVKTNDRKLSQNTLDSFVSEIICVYEHAYPSLKEKKEHIVSTISSEIQKFERTLSNGLKEFKKVVAQSDGVISGEHAFVLFSTYGFPLELTRELAEDHKLHVDEKGYHSYLKQHQEESRKGAEKKFKGGLADTSDETVKLHTAHHLLLAALQEVLGESVKQKGSNITPERLRIDFSFDRKLTQDEREAVEKIVNDNIKSDLHVIKRVMKKEEAEKLGAEMEFGASYPDTVSVYFIEDSEGNVISKEFCGGPHVERTGELGVFTIKKEQASSAGVRRIKAVLTEE